MTSSSDEEAQQDGAIVLVGSSDLASNDKLALGVCLNEANIPLERGEPAMSGAPQLPPRRKRGNGHGTWTPLP